MKDENYLITLFFFSVIVGPLVFIWVLNTLFQLNIEYSLETWAASVIITNAAFFFNFNSR